MIDLGNPLAYSMYFLRGYHDIVTILSGIMALVLLRLLFLIINGLIKIDDDRYGRMSEEIMLCTEETVLKGRKSEYEYKKT